jgi:exosortase
MGALPLLGNGNFTFSKRLPPLTRRFRVRNRRSSPQRRIESSITQRIVARFMADASEAQPITDSPDHDRGFFDLPDFQALGHSFVSWCRRNPVQLLLLGGILGVIGYFYFGVKAFLSLSQTAAQWIAASWNAENDQEHCWAIIPVAILLAMLRWRDLRAAPKTPSNSGLWFIAAGIIGFVVGVRCIEARYTIFAIPLLCYGMTRYLFGAAVARIVLFPCVFLLFMTPFGGIVQSTAQLQSKTAAVIHHLSTAFGIPIHVEGARIVSLDGRFEPLEVAGGCSGIRSLMAMLTLSALYAYFVMRTPMRGMILFGLSIVFAVLGNFARVFSVVLFARFIDPKTATGLYHDYSGFVFFPVAVLAMVGVGNLLNRDWSGALRRWMTPSPAATSGAARNTDTVPGVTVAEPVAPAKTPEPPKSYDY